MAIQNPVIVVPGITATDLHDDYPLKTEDLWTMVLNKEFDRISLHPDDLRYEAKGPAHVYAGRIFSIYDDLIKALRHELCEKADCPTPVFAFPYDWRTDVRTTARHLGEFIDEVISRTCLLKHYKSASPKTLKVDLVGHSMGGLVILEYLAQAAKQSRVRKVVTLGTPFLGSIEAVIKIATGMGILAGNVPKERERESARVTPAVYQLFPSYAGAVVNTKNQDLDIFDVKNIQPSVVASLTEFVRMYSVKTRATERKKRAQSILGDLLRGGRDHRGTVNNFKTATAGLSAGDWLCVAGVGEKSRVQITVQRDDGNPWFRVDDTQFVSDLKSGATGDGTVPLGGALPPFLPRNQVVCVVDDDLGFWELGDKLLSVATTFHALLPKVNLVQRLAIRHLKPDFGGKVWGRRVPGGSSWKPPIRGIEEKKY